MTKTQTNTSKQKGIGMLDEEQRLTSYLTLSEGKKGDGMKIELRNESVQGTQGHACTTYSLSIYESKNENAIGSTGRKKHAKEGSASVASEKRDDAKTLLYINDLKTWRTRASSLYTK